MLRAQSLRLGQALTGASSTATAGSVSVFSADVTAALAGASSSSTAGTLSSASTLALLGLTGSGAAGSVAPSLGQALTGASSTAAAGAVSVFSADVTVSLFGVSSPGSAGTVTQTGGTPPPDPFIAIIGGGIARKLKKQREDEETELAQRVAAQALAEAQLTEFVPAPRRQRMTPNVLTKSLDGTAAAVARKSRQRSEDDLMLMY